MTAREFWRIYREICRRRWLGLSIFGASFGTVLLGCIVMPRYYRASAYVMPSEVALSRPLIPGAASVSGQAPERAIDARTREEQMATLMGLAETSEVRQRAIKSLGLNATPEELARAVNVEPGSGSIIKISAVSRTPAEAVSLANTIAHQFAAYYEDLRSVQARLNREFLQGEVAQAEAERQRAKSDLQAFKGHAGEAALPPGSDRNPFLSQFYALRAQIDDTRSRLESVEGRLRVARGELDRQSPTRQTETSTSDNLVTQQLQDELARLEKELVSAQSRYTEKHPKVRDLKAQIAGIRGRLSRQDDRMVSNRTIQANPVYEKLGNEIVDLSGERAALASQLGALTKAMAANEERAGRLADSSVLLTAKTREYDDAQDRYARLKTILDQARVDEKASAKAALIQVVDEAKSATGAVMQRGPSPAQLLLAGLALSVCLALGTILGLAFVDDRIHSRQDLLRQLELPVQAVIPRLQAGNGRTPLARIAELQPLSPYAEAYRFLRTEVMHLGDGSPLRTLVVATARPGHGGTTTAVNLAITLAEAGNRVVLVDADLRRPTLHKFFGLSNEAGLTSLLSNGASAAENALRRTSMESLLLLPAGPPAGNPAALLNSSRMLTVLQHLREHSDYVVIDTPSAATFADAAVVGRLVDGVIMVMRANESVREAEYQTIQLFNKVGAKLVGLVLNSALPSSVDSYYFHNHYYPTATPTRDDRTRIGPGDSAAALPNPQPEKAPAWQYSRPKSRRPESTAMVVRIPDWVGSPGGSPAADSRVGAPRARPQPAPRASVAAHRGRRMARAAIASAVALVALAALSARVVLPRGSGSAKPKAATAPAVRPGTAALTVTATVKAPVEVRVDRDGTLLYEGPLAVGQQVWQASQMITLWASRPAAVDLAVNGRPVGPLGRDGDPPRWRRFTAEDGAAR